MEAQAAATPQLLQDEIAPPTGPIGNEESKADRFVRLAEPRVDRALTAIRIISNLANRSLYEYEPDDVEAITATLSQALDDMKARFRMSGPRQMEMFRLRR